MLIRDIVIDFYNQLALSGMKAPDFTEEAIQQRVRKQGVRHREMLVHVTYKLI